MRKIVSAMEARRKLGELLEGVYYRDDEIVIERAGKPMAALLPMQRLHALDRARKEGLEYFEELRRSVVDPLPEEEAMKLALEAVAEVRRKKRIADSKRSA